jgi:hypothetical protein
VNRASVLAAVLLAGVAAAATTDEFRYSRPIQAPPGWARLELPDDVLDACRPGLPDLRIVDAAGRDVPYAIEQEPARAETWKAFPALNLESVEKVETVFQIDRGPRPGITDAVTLEVEGGEFLKPVRVQSSADRETWKDVASGSIFATGDVRMQTLPLPATDRRYLQFRLDDRNGAPLRPEGAKLRVRGRGETSVTERPLALEPRAAEPREPSRYRATLPAANLAVSALRFQAADPAFSRPVRVYERVFFRDEVHRRLVAAGVLDRAPGSKEPIDLPVSGIAGRNLEIEIDGGDSPPLEELGAVARVRATTLRFRAPEDRGLVLAYGSASAGAPRYDLARALATSTGTDFASAAPGPPSAARPPAPAVATPPRAPLADPESWSVRRNIELPADGSVAYLDFAHLPDPSEIRILDAENRQVPFILEGGSHEHAQDIRLEVVNAGTATRARLDGLPAGGAVDAIELTASGPDYFSRQVAIEEEERDARGVTGTRTLGGARWERRPGEPQPALRIPLARPGGNDPRLFAVIENGDNVPLTLAGARAFTSAVRLDFVYRPGEKLTLLSGNPQARPPAYDLAMVASAVLAAPAEAARIGAAAAAAPGASEKSTRPAWFWAAVGAAVLLLLFQLQRVLAKTV